MPRIEPALLSVTTLTGSLRPAPRSNVVAFTIRLVVAVIALASNVAAPVRVMKWPFMLLPLTMVPLDKEMMVPLKVVPVPSVVELPTWKKTFEASAPLIRLTLAPVAVVSVLAIWKTYWPWPLRVSTPVSAADEENLYTPGVSVIPPRSKPVRSPLCTSPTGIAKPANWP